MKPTYRPVRVCIHCGARFVTRARETSPVPFSRFYCVPCLRESRARYKREGISLKPIVEVRP
jgi:hypothetical protein